MAAGSTPTRLILVMIAPEAMPDDTVDRLRRIAPDHEVLLTTDWDVIQERAREVVIAAGNGPHRLLPLAPNLRWFQQFSAGSDWLRDHPEWRDGSYVLTNASGVHPIQIAEHVFGVLLTMTRRLDVSIRAKELREWTPVPSDGVVELEGKVMLIIGVGAIGRRIARIAKAFGMRVVGVRRNPDGAVDGVDQLVPSRQLDEVLPDADVVVLTLPLTDESYRLIDASRVRSMKESAYVINIGRGGTLDERALVDALNDGRIAGAALDVFEREPLDPASELWNAKNLIITAHYAGASPEYNARVLDILAENLARFVDGRPLLNVVDREAGY